MYKLRVPINIEAQLYTAFSERKMSPTNQKLISVVMKSRKLILAKFKTFFILVFLGEYVHN